MNKILSGIKSVPGVWGTLAIDKKKALIYQLMPSNYDSDVVKAIAIPTLNLGRFAEKNLVADFFFESGKGRLYSTREAIVVILGRKDMSFDSLGAVCRDIIPVISRRFSRTDSADGNPDGPHPEISFEFLLKTMNILASNVQQKIGAYLVTKHLRNAKDSLFVRFRFLATIAVDNNGVISLMKGYPEYTSDDLVQAFAQWANLFLLNCAHSGDKLKDINIKDLTSEISDKLEAAGFYRLFENQAEAASINAQIAAPA